MSSKSNVAFIMASAILGAVLGAGISYALMQPMIASLQSSQSTLDSRVNSLGTSQTGLASRVDALNSSQLGLSQRTDQLGSVQSSQDRKLEALNSSQLELKNSLGTLNTSLSHVERDVTQHLGQRWHIAYDCPYLSSSSGVYTTNTFEIKGPGRLLWSFDANNAGCWLEIEIRYSTNGTLFANRRISGVYDKDTSDLLDIQPGFYYLVLRPSINIVEYYVDVYHTY